MLAIRISGMSGWPLRALQPSNFCLEGALFHQLGVNLCIRLCDVKYYVSARMFDFLDLAKNCILPNQKLIVFSRKGFFSAVALIDFPYS